MSLLWRSFPYSFSSRCPPQQCIHNSITPLHTSHSLLRDLSYPFPLPVPPGLEPYQIVFIFSAPGPWQAFPPGLYLSWKQSGSKQEWINSVFRVHWSIRAVWPGGVTTLTWNFRIFLYERSCLHFKITAQWKLPELWRQQAVTLPHHLGKQAGWGGALSSQAALYPFLPSSPTRKVPWRYITEEGLVPSSCRHITATVLCFWTYNRCFLWSLSKPLTFSRESGWLCAFQTVSG